MYIETIEVKEGKLRRSDSSSPTKDIDDRDPIKSQRKHENVGRLWSVVKGYNFGETTLWILPKTGDWFGTDYGLL